MVSWTSWFDIASLLFGALVAPLPVARAGGADNVGATLYSPKPEWAERCRELASYDSLAPRLCQGGGKYAYPLPAVKSALEAMAPLAKKIGAEYGVDPRAIIGAILAENSLNVTIEDSVQSFLVASKISPRGRFMGHSFSYGFGQLYCPAAWSAEPVAAQVEGRPVRTQTEVCSSLTVPENTLRYVAAIHKQSIEAYARHGMDISGKPEILASLYNLGGAEARAQAAEQSHTAPKPNFFGMFVEFYLPVITEMVERAPDDAATSAALAVGKPEPFGDETSQIRIKDPLMLYARPDRCASDVRGSVRNRSTHVPAGTTLVDRLEFAEGCRDGDEWQLVRTLDGQTGWVSSDDLMNRSQVIQAPSCDAVTPPECSGAVEGLKAELGADFLGYDADSGVVWVRNAGTNPDSGQALPEVSSVSSSDGQKRSAAGRGRGAKKAKRQAETEALALATSGQSLSPEDFGKLAAWKKDFQDHIAAEFGLTGGWDDPANPFRFLDLRAPLDCALDFCSRRSDVRCSVTDGGRDALQRLMQLTRAGAAISSPQDTFGVQNWIDALDLKIEKLPTPPIPEKGARADLLAVLGQCATAVARVPGEKPLLASVLGRVSQSSDALEACTRSVAPEYEALGELCQSPALKQEAVACEAAVNGSTSPGAALPWPGKVLGQVQKLAGVGGEGADLSRPPSESEWPTLTEVGARISVIDRQLQSYCGSPDGHCGYRRQETRARIERILQNNACAARAVVYDPVLVSQIEDQASPVMDRVISRTGPVPGGQGDRFGIELKRVRDCGSLISKGRALATRADPPPTAPELKAVVDNLFDMKAFDGKQPPDRVFADWIHDPKTSAATIDALVQDVLPARSGQLAYADLRKSAWDELLKRDRAGEVAGVRAALVRNAMAVGGATYENEREIFAGFASDPKTPPEALRNLTRYALLDPENITSEYRNALYESILKNPAADDATLADFASTVAQSTLVKPEEFKRWLLAALRAPGASDQTLGAVLSRLAELDFTISKDDKVLKAEPAVVTDAELASAIDEVLKRGKAVGPETLKGVAYASIPLAPSVKARILERVLAHPEAGADVQAQMMASLYTDWKPSSKVGWLSATTPYFDPPDWQRPLIEKLVLGDSKAGTLPQDARQGLLTALSNSPSAQAWVTPLLDQLLARAAKDPQGAELAVNWYQLGWNGNVPSAGRLPEIYLSKVKDPKSDAAMLLAVLVGVAEAQKSRPLTDLDAILWAALKNPNADLDVKKQVAALGSSSGIKDPAKLLRELLREDTDPTVLEYAALGLAEGAETYRRPSGETLELVDLILSDPNVNDQVLSKLAGIAVTLSADYAYRGPALTANQITLWEKVLARVLDHPAMGKLAFGDVLGAIRRGSGVAPFNSPTGYKDPEKIAARLQAIVLDPKRLASIQTSPGVEILLSALNNSGWVRWPANADWDRSAMLHALARTDGLRSGVYRALAIPHPSYRSILGSDQDVADLVADLCRNPGFLASGSLPDIFRFGALSDLPRNQSIYDAILVCGGNPQAPNVARDVLSWLKAGAPPPLPEPDTTRFLTKLLIDDDWANGDSANLASIVKSMNLSSVGELYRAAIESPRCPISEKAEWVKVAVDDSQAFGPGKGKLVPILETFFKQAIARSYFGNQLSFGYVVYRLPASEDRGSLVAVYFETLGSTGASKDHGSFLQEGVSAIANLCAGQDDGAGGKAPGADEVGRWVARMLKVPLMPMSDRASVLAQVGAEIQNCAQMGHVSKAQGLALVERIEAEAEAQREAFGTEYKPLVDQLNRDRRAIQRDAH